MVAISYGEDGDVTLALGYVTRYMCSAIVFEACGNVILRQGVDLRRRYEVIGVSLLG